jgi:hypothetical protein
MFIRNNKKKGYSKVRLIESAHVPKREINEEILKG